MPAYNRHDLLLRALRSIDVPVERGLILDNGRNIRDADEWGEIVGECGRLNLEVFTPPFASIGYGGAINFTILQTADAPWWMWVSNDVQFLPGHLQTVIDRMAVLDPRIVTGGFTWAAINRALVDKVGLIDEHGFFPIYYDDNDYHQRCKIAGVEWVEDWATGTVHGDGEHGASLTIHSDGKSRAGNSRSFLHNTREYLAKWGGRPGEEQYTSPWNSGMPVWVTRPSIDGRRDRQW